MTKHIQVPALPLLIVPFLVLVCSAAERVLVMGDEELHFTPAPERGYVVKLGETTGGIKSLSSLSGLDMAQAKVIRGRDRHGIWTVENGGPAAQNEQDIAKIGKQSQVAYVAPLFSSNGETVAVIPEIVVRVRPDIEMGDVQSLCKKAGCTIRKPMEFTTQEYLLDVLGPDADAVFTAVRILNQRPEVEWACADMASPPKRLGRAVQRDPIESGQLQAMAVEQDLNTLAVFPNDELFPTQWHLHNTGQYGYAPDADINAPEAWEITTGDPNIVIAVCDTGVELTHPDLIDNLVPGYDFYDGDDDPSPALGENETHGTMCAGFISAQGNNGIGVTGVAWNCKIMPIRMRIYTNIPYSAVADGIRWAAANGADILNHSWGSYNPMPMIRSAIVDVTKPGGIGRDGKGCVVVACAHNTSADVHNPAAFPEVIAVGATGYDDSRWDYSCHGPELDIMAPSGSAQAPWTLGIWTTDITGIGGWSSYNTDPNISDYVEGCGGTSVSAPIVAGVAALILSVEPDLTNEEVQHFLTRSARDLGDIGWDEYYGWGRVDARAALDMVLAKRADLNNDWVVDEEDEAILIQAMDANDLSADIAPAGKRDGVVDANDLALLTLYLGTAIPELGLIAHWKLDETEGTSAHDGAGKHHTATVMGLPLWQPDGGMMGGALHLDGVEAYVETPSVLNPADGPFSVFVWIKGDTADQVVLSQSGGRDWLSIDSTGALMTDLRGQGRKAKTLYSQTVITDEQWHRVGLTWDGATRSLYVDDVMVAEDAPGPLPDVSEGLHIGAAVNLEAGGFFSGLIDDVRLYNRAVVP